MTLQKKLIEVDLYTYDRYINGYNAPSIDYDGVSIKKSLIISDNSYSSVRDLEKEIKNEILKKPSVNKLTTQKTIHFMPGTKFNRQMFRSMFPNVKIKLDPSKSDIVCYDSNLTVSIGSGYKYAHQYAMPSGKSIYADEKFRSIISTANSHRYSNFSVDESKLGLPCKISQLTHVGYSYMISTEQYEKIVKLLSLNVPLITAEDLFVSSDSTEYKQKDIDLDEIVNIYKQAISGDKDVSKTGIDFVCTLSTEKYLPIQCLILGMTPNKFNSPRIDIFHKMIDSKYPKLRGVVRSSISSLAQLIESIHVILAAQSYYSKSVDYQMFFDLLNHPDFSSRFTQSLTGGDYFTVGINITPNHKMFGLEGDSVESPEGVPLNGAPSSGPNEFIL